MKGTLRQIAANQIGRPRGEATRCSGVLVKRTKVEAPSEFSVSAEAAKERSIRQNSRRPPSQQGRYSSQGHSLVATKPASSQTGSGFIVIGCRNLSRGAGTGNISRGCGNISRGYGYIS